MTCYHQCHFCGAVYDHNGKICHRPFWDGIWWETMPAGERILRATTWQSKCNHHRAPQFPEIHDNLLSSKLE